MPGGVRLQIPEDDEKERSHSYQINMISVSGVVDMTLRPASLFPTRYRQSTCMCGRVCRGGNGQTYCNQMSQSEALNGRESSANGLNHVQDIVRRNLFDSNVIIKRKDMRHNT